MGTTASDKAEIRDTGTSKGKGVFATRFISEGETIEVCKVILVSYGLLSNEAKNRAFNWAGLTGDPEGKACLAQGWGGMYNHANPANTRYVAKPEKMTLEFTAARDIQEGEEITINYEPAYGDIHSTEESWFKDRGIDPI